MLVMQYASGGDLHNYLQREFTRITWKKGKLDILWQISRWYILNIIMHYYHNVH